MSLDQNLFTLNVTQRADDRNIVDLVDSKGTAHYTKRRLPGTEYNIEVYDPLSEGLLASVTAPSPTSKHKTLQLHNPDIIVELKSVGTISFKWGFKWEDHDFEWKREECYILRKPDPSVLVAVTKEPPGRLQTRAVQLLDYNLNRFDINDRKGLEIVILTALLTFQDLNETYHVPRERSTSVADAAAVATVAEQSNVPPVVPPRPEPRQGADRVAEMHAVRNAQGEGDANEIEVWEECTIDDYAQYAERLLNDEAMLFISIRSASAVQVPKVLRVVEETKRLRHKSGVAEDQELHQYVIYDSDKQTRKGPKRINLDDPNTKKSRDQYTPPSSLIVHLSKIPMPELQPKASPGTARRTSGAGRASSPQRPMPPAPPSVPQMSDKERKRLEKEAKKNQIKRPERDDKKLKKDKGRESTPPYSAKPGASSEKPGPPYHTPAYQVHSYQPSPSPAQLNNPAIYASAPPPLPHATRPRSVSMAFPMPDTQAGSMPPGYGSMPAPPRTPQPPASRPNLSAPQVSGRPSSFYGSKGPVSSLLDLWSKH